MPLFPSELGESHDEELGESGDDERARDEFAGTERRWSCGTMSRNLHGESRQGEIMKKILVAVLALSVVAVGACGPAVAPLEIYLVNLDLGNGEAQVWTEMSDAALSEWTPAQRDEFLDLQKQGNLEVAV
jgi:hypothetical protein